MKFIFASLLLAGPAFAATHDYQVTGPVEEVTPQKIVVKKGNQHWEIARDPTTKMEGDPKVGDKVTVYYSMTATDVEVKPKSKK